MLLQAIVIRCNDIERSRCFYEVLGMQFKEEKHGTGPRHFSTALAGSLVLELYPGRPTLTSNIQTYYKNSGTTMWSFTVTDLNRVVGELKKYNAKLIIFPRIEPEGLHARVLDPDGFAVDLWEITSDSSAGR